MSKLTLQNLLEYGTSSYILDNNHKYNLSEEIKKIKQNSLNEKAVIFKYDFIELNYFHKNPYNEMVLIYSISSNNKWHQFLNCFLILYDNTYIKNDNYEKKNLVISYFDKLPNKTETLDNFNSFLKNYKFNLIIISDNDINIFNNGYDKFLIIVLFENEYYPLYNLLTKYFKSNSSIVEYIIKNNTNNNNNNKKNKNEKDEYLELQTNNECELSLTELDDKKIIINKFTKDIFIPHKNTSNTDTNALKSNDSTDNKKKDLIKSAKTTLSLKQLQDIASLLEIPLVCGILKNGNPKYRTKPELLEDIKNCKV